jgi:hypothetical protein
MLCVSGSPLSAAERYAIIVTGASGGARYAENYEAWRTRFEVILREDFGYPSGHVVVLSEDADEGRRSTREDVRAAFTELGRRAQDDDVVLVLLMGHGSSFYADPAKFNLVGPDLTVDEWAELTRLIHGRLVFVNSTGASFPFLEQLSGPNRIVLTATDSAFQQYDTVFPEFFVSAFADSAADLDKNSRVSIWEAFSYASAGVANWFGLRGRLATERPLIDDTGDGIGSEAGLEGPDGELARATFLEPDVSVASSGNAALVALYERRADIEARLDRLKTERVKLSPEQYEEQLESLLLELALVDRQLRRNP